MTAKFPGFRVAQRLVLNKPFVDHLKFFIKDVLAYFGYSLNGWHDYRRYYYTPWKIAPYLTVARLPQETIDVVVQKSDDWMKKSIAEINSFNESQLPFTTQGQALPLIREIISRDPRHKRILDIGSSYSKVFRHMALEFPDFTWDMIDFPAKLAEFNADIRTDNMYFHSGYPLDFVEQTQNKYDVANFNRVLALMGSEQIGAYLNALKERARYIVFAEPCKILFEPGSLDIDAIFPNMPRSQRGLFFIHNYRAVFRKYGYNLIHYDADSSRQINSTPNHFIIRGVAVANQ